MKIFIWQSSIENHQYYTWLSLHELTNSGVTFVLGQTENDNRKNQGWKPVDLTKLNVIFLPASKLWQDGTKLIRETPDAIHIFMAFRGTQKGYDYFPLILYSLLRNVKVAILNEPYAIQSIGYYQDEDLLSAQFKVWIRPVLYRAMAFFINLASRSRKPCMFPISLIAKEQFKKSGFVTSSIFPFGWFVPRFNNDQKEEKNEQTKQVSLSIVYIGVLIKRKGVDILMQAVKFLRAQGYNVTLDMYGAGYKQGDDCPEDEIFNKGLLPFESVQSTIRRYDVLALPSRHDGWGVVVNESLLQGVPVIVSNRVGAKCLVESGQAGLVFTNENFQDLAEKIKMLIEDRVLLAKLSENAMKVGDQILPEYGARYFLAVLDHYFFQKDSRPRAIWSEETL